MESYLSNHVWLLCVWGVCVVVGDFFALVWGCFGVLGFFCVHAVFLPITPIALLRTRGQSPPISCMLYKFISCHVIRTYVSCQKALTETCLIFFL